MDRPSRPRVAALLLAAALAAGCSGPGGPGASLGTTASATPGAASGAVAVDARIERERGLQRLLDRRSRAVLDRDRAAFAATLESTTSGFGRRQLELFESLAALPLATFDYGTPEPAPALSPERARQVGPDAFVTRVRGRYTLAGYDRAPRTYETHLTVVRRGDSWRLADDADGGTQPQLWDLPGLHTAASTTTLVVASGAVRDLTPYLRMGDRAVARVDRVWRQRWGSRLVLVVPATVAEMAAQLGQPTAAVEQVAAVTDGPLGPDGLGGADRVVVNPGAFARLQPAGRQVVVTHEATHVAVRASVPGEVPLWLSEGLADYIGYQGVGLSRERIAAPLLEQVRAGQGPRALPVEADFDPATATIAPSYNAAWLAACLVADVHGEQALVRLYRQAASGSGSTRQRTEAAFSSVLGTSQAQFTRSWLDYVAALARR